MRCFEMLRDFAFLAGAAALLLGGPAVRAEHLGTLSKTYPVVETDLRLSIEQLLPKPLRDPKAVQEMMRKSVRKFFDELPPVKGIQWAERSRTRFMDLTHVLGQDVPDGKGRVLAKAGTRINLLANSRLESRLLLLDGRDARQLAMLERLWAARANVQPILVAGSYTLLAQRYRRGFFYDYGGRISGYFGVRRVPALIGQDGERIRIEEIKP